ncbi:hypothetical protein V1264_013337 [Littorina saxatilis]|uniref:H15 domain-containing protein n=1 Tax=Littorina saxatilis TaxID=31220 RepID=A0AAN9GIL7_9CAEN
MRGRAKQEAGVTKSSGVVAGNAGAVSTSNTSHRGRGRPPKEAMGGAVGLKKVRKIGPSTTNTTRPFSLTAVRVAHVISQLDNKRGSTLDSIRSKLIREGHSIKTALVRNALDRAIASGLLREVREERFSIPKRLATASASSSSSASSKRVRRVASSGSGTQHKAKPSGSAARSGSSADTKKRQRRPPQGRRPATGVDSGAAHDGNEMRDDDETGLGDGDVDEGNEMGEKGGSRVSVSEPVAGCDAVMVFGTH